MTEAPMIDAGIFPGDQVLVKRGATAKDGDIVIGEVWWLDDEISEKRRAAGHARSGEKSL